MNLCIKYEKRERMLSSLVGYSLSLAVIWGIILFFNLPIISKATGLSYVLIVSLYLLSTFTNLIYCWIFVKQYEYSYKVVVFETLLSTLGTCFGSLFAIAFISKTAEAKIIPQVLTITVIGLFIVVRVLRSGKAFYDKEVWAFAFSFCVPLLPHYLSEIILMSSDRIMIDRMCGSSDVAIYSVAYSVGSLISMVTGAVNSAFAPYQYQKITSKEYRALAKNTNIVIGFVAFCLCGVMLFGREIVLVFGGCKYLSSISLIIPISLGVFFNYVFQLFGRVQEYFEQKHTIVIASISCAMLNILLNYIFIKIFGYQAAAYTTFVCYFVFCFLHYLFYRMACKKHVGQEIYDTKRLVFISAVLIVVAVFTRFINGFYILKYLILTFALVTAIWQRRRILQFIHMIREE